MATIVEGTGDWSVCREWGRSASASFFRDHGDAYLIESRSCLSGGRAPERHERTCGAGGGIGGGWKGREVGSVYGRPASCADGGGGSACLEVGAVSIVRT